MAPKVSDPPDGRGATERTASMTRREFAQALTQYRAGLEAELALLHQLTALPTAGRRPEAMTAGARSATADDRDRVMANIASIEHDLTPVRAALSAAGATLRGMPAFEAVVELHHQAGELVARILASDRHAFESLEDAKRARRFAANEVEKGDTTLAAYRRIVAPPLEDARIVDRRG
jgi:hypothetical protein